MIIRKAEMTDVENMLDMGEAMHRESVYSFMMFSWDKSRALIQWIIEHSRLGETFAAVAEKRGAGLVGMMGAYQSEHWFSHDPICSDYLLYVMPEHRGSFAALGLLMAYQEWALKTSAKLITAGVSASVDAGPIIDFYKSRGFKDFGVTLRLEV